VSRPTTQVELPDGAIRLTASDGCAFTLRRLRPGAIEITIQGYDTGKVGDAFLDLMSAEVRRYKPLEMFVDARQATGVVTPVRETWTAWFQSHQADLKHVTVLVSDKLVSSAVGVAKHFSRTGDLMRIVGDPQRFEELVAAARG
jgi:hypothetical protein